MIDIDVIVDPFILLWPVEVDAMSVQSYFGRIRRWSTVLKAREACTSSRVIAQLMTDRAYPTSEKIAAAIREHGIDDFSPLDIRNALRIVSERQPFIEDRTGIDDVVADVSVFPANATDRLGSAACSAAWAGALAAVSLHVERNACEVPCLGSWDLPSRWVRVSGVVEMVQSEDQIESVQRNIDSTFVVREDPAEFDGPIFFNDETDPIALIQHLYTTDVARLDSNPPRLRRIVVGPNFVHTLRDLRLQSSYIRSVYRRCAEAACGISERICGAKRHPVRVSAAADAPQVVRSGGDRKWRCTVSKSGAGYRMHYWEFGDGSGIELDSVMVESEVR